MQVTLELWHVISLVLAFLGCIYAFGETLMKQVGKGLDERFRTLETIRSESSSRWEREFADLERRLDNIANDLPNQYVRREDWIRFSSTTDAKLDALHRKLDSFSEKLYARP